MPLYKLPIPLLSWAWTPQYLAKLEQVAHPQGLILPPTAKPAPDPAFCHFSQMREDGVFSWLWFFSDQQQAAALRTMQVMPVRDDLAELVQLTVPRSLPDCPNPTYLQVVDADYLRGLPLRDLGINEVWVGFDYRRYIGDRNARASTELVLSAEEFCEVAAR
jgi:hypothetical protein